MLALIIGGGLRWVLIGVALLLIWYILAPLFTPARRSPQRDRDRATGTTGKRRRARRKGQDFEVIEGDGRVID